MTEEEDTSDLVPLLIGDEDDVKEAWKYYAWCAAFEWKFLPRAGGLEDQDDVLMNNIFEVRNMVEKARKK